MSNLPQQIIIIIIIIIIEYLSWITLKFINNRKNNLKV